MKRFTIPIIGLAILLLGYLAWLFRSQNRDAVQSIFGGSKFLNAFVTSQDVTAYRLHHRDDAPGNSDLLNHYDWSNRVSVAVAQVADLKHLLQQPSSYDWNTRYAKACILNYGVILQFQNDSSGVGVALCFDCNMLGVYDTTGTNMTRLNTEWDFDPIREQLVAAVKSIFPGDPEIQKLR